MDLSDVLKSKPGKERAQFLIDTGNSQKLAIGKCRGGKAIRDTNSLWRKVLKHFTQRRVLAANDGNIGNTTFIEP